MTNYENIIKIIRENAIENWTVKSSKSDSNSVVFKTNDAGMENNIERMNKIMMLYKGDYFVFQGKDNSASGRGNYLYEFSNNNKEENLNVNRQIPYVSGISPEDVQKQIDLAVAKVKMEFREEDLLRREKELKEERKAFIEEKESVVGIAISKLGAVLPKIFPKVAVAGIDDNPIKATQLTNNEQPITEEDDRIKSVNEVSEDVTVKVENLMNRWLAVDEDCVALLEKIVCLAESGDSKYTMAKTLI